MHSIDEQEAFSRYSSRRNWFQERADERRNLDQQIKTVIMTYFGELPDPDKPLVRIGSQNVSPKELAASIQINNLHQNRKYVLSDRSSSGQIEDRLYTEPDYDPNSRTEKP